MTSRTRTLLAFALILLVVMPVGAALANQDPPGQRSASPATAVLGSIDRAVAGAASESTTAAPRAKSSNANSRDGVDDAATAPSAPDTTASTAPGTISSDPSTSAAPTTVAASIVAPTTTPAITTSTRRIATAPTAPASAPPVTVDPATAATMEAALRYAQGVQASEQAAAAKGIAPGPANTPVATPPPSDNPLDQLSAADQGFLACVRWRESRGDYTVVNSSSGAGGAYQFMQSTWNITATHLGRGDLIGLRPNLATPHDQDLIAVHLLTWYGRSPWSYYCG